ncbi:hypothetical protein D3C86_1568670 [compost metagenome]
MRYVHDNLQGKVVPFPQKLLPIFSTRFPIVDYALHRDGLCYRKLDKGYLRLKILVTIQHFQKQPNEPASAILRQFLFVHCLLLIATKAPLTYAAFYHNRIDLIVVSPVRIQILNIHRKTFAKKPGLL